MEDDVGAGYVVVNEEGDLMTGMKVAGPQTVNRSELVAQYAVLMDIPPERPLSIYTDSRCSIQKRIACSLGF